MMGVGMIIVMQRARATDGFWPQADMDACSA